MIARPCPEPRCPNTQPCPTHARRAWAKSDTPDISGWAWQRLRTRIIVRDGGVCQLRLDGCTIRATTADHIVGRAEGGRSIDSNLRASCRSCNVKRGHQQSAAARAR